ncbi:NAD(P)-binding protein [Exidia glandulosa HHB12029]|uniref:NAD(P)-binding protein n=1 Tax=Exidia glandulosa HHB12029 TaxID=1314781 RepID=A0A165GTR8_EXIGL|nr:NAD(P)-binding protein [Exidia glandulosa HHB12029]
MPKSFSGTIFFLGPTGYLGGGLLKRLIVTYPKARFVTLVRSESVIALVKAAGVHEVIQGTHKDLETIKKAASEADLIINAADADDASLVSALLAGAKAGGKRPVFVHTSGTGVVGDKAQGKLDANFLAHPFDDTNEEAVKNIPADALHRNVDLLVFAADTEGYVDAWILSPPTVYGAPSGIAGVPPRNSIQIPMIIAMALKMGQAVVVGEGTATWDNVHVQDLVEAYILVIAKAVSSHHGNGSKGFFTKLFKRDANSGSKSVSSYAKFHNVASDRHAWSDLVAIIAQSLHARGVIPTSDVKSITLAEANTVHPWAFAVANNALVLPSRLQALGWTPSHTNWKKDVDADVERVLNSLASVARPPQDRVILWYRLLSAPSRSLQPQRLSLLSRERVMISNVIVPSMSETRTTFFGLKRSLWTIQRVCAERLELPSDSDRDALLSRIRTLMDLRHPHLQTIFGISTLHLETFLVTHYVKVQPLPHVLRQDPLVDRRAVVLKAAKGLRYLHEHGVTHGNIRAANVYISRSPPRVILAGFGAPCVAGEFAPFSALPLWAEVDARNAEPDPASDSDIPDEPKWNRHVVPRSRRRVVITTDKPVSSDIVQSADLLLRSTDFRGDVFAFGCFIVEAFTGLAPYENQSALLILRLALNKLRPPHPGRAAEVLGLDALHWKMCLACWGIDRDEPIAIGNLVDTLGTPRDDIIICPVDWDTDSLACWTKPRVPDLDRRIHGVQKLKRGRDIEKRIYELRGTLLLKRLELRGCRIRLRTVSRAIKLIPVRFHRRDSLRGPHDRLAEMMIWCQLQHPHILPLLGTCYYREGRMPAFVVPWMGGGTCTDYVTEHPDADRISLASNVADALEYLHTRAPVIVHGDVRAYSVVVSDDGVACLANFDFRPEQLPTEGFDGSDLSHRGRSATRPPNNSVRG